MEQYWEKEARLAKERRELKEKYPLLGKKVRRRGRSKWEEGIVVLSSLDDIYYEEFIEYKPGDCEQLLGLPFQIWDENLNIWLDN